MARLRILASLLVLGALGAPSRAQLTQGVQPPKIDWIQRLGSEVPLGTTLTDSSGAQLTLADCLTDKPVILALVYYECPMLCDLVLNGLVRCLRALTFDAGADFELIALSIDPDEGPELAHAKLQGYLKEYGRTDADTEASGWRFLVGSKEAVRSIADAVGFEYEYLPGTGEFAHPAGITLLTPEGRVSRYFYGTEFAPRDVKFGLIEAADGAIGSPVDKVILRCFSYDPARGKYGFAILGAIRFLGSLTVLVLGFFIVRMVLRDRRRSRAVHPPEALERGA